MNTDFSNPVSFPKTLVDLDLFEAWEVLVESDNLVYIVFSPHSVANINDNLGSGYALINLSPKASVNFRQNYLNALVFDETLKTYPWAALGSGYINFV